jgi:hypothetical protein
MPSSVAFLANLPSTYDITGTSQHTQYLGGRFPSTPAAPIMNTIYDIGGDFYPGNGTTNPARFTAPSDGTYFFVYNFLYYYGSGVSPSGHFQLGVVTTTRQYTSGATVNNGTLPPYVNVNFCVEAPMSAGDTAVFGFINTYNVVINAAGSAATAPITWVAGYKL